MYDSNMESIAITVWGRTSTLMDFLPNNINHMAMNKEALVISTALDAKLSIFNKSISNCSDKYFYYGFKVYAQSGTRAA